MGKIIISGKTYRFKTVPIYLGKKKINREISKTNLLDFQHFMSQKSIPFSISYGTLLGAIRDRNFIEYDEDVDINMLEADKNKFLESLFDLRKSGFNVARYDRRGLISIIRNGEHIDIYFFNKLTGNIYECGGNFLLEKWLIELQSVSFLDSTFLIPKDYLGFLEFEYGKNWNIPVQYSYNLIQKMVSRLSFLIKQVSPDPIIYYLLDQKNKQKRKIIVERLQQIE